MPIKAEVNARIVEALVDVLEAAEAAGFAPPREPVNLELAALVAAVAKAREAISAKQG